MTKSASKHYVQTENGTGTKHVPVRASSQAKAEEIVRRSGVKVIKR